MKWAEPNWARTGQSYDFLVLDLAKVSNAQIVNNSPVAQKTGGINFTNKNNFLEIKNDGHGIKFHLDHAQLVQLQNAPGFVPVIINIQPMTSLRQFLGLDIQGGTLAVAK